MQFGLMDADGNFLQRDGTWLPYGKWAARFAPEHGVVALRKHTRPGFNCALVQISSPGSYHPEATRAHKDFHLLAEAVA